MRGTQHGPRAVALVGPAGAGKTSLAEALLFASGAIPRQGQVAAGTSTGDSSPEARARGGSTELNLMRLNFMGEDFVLIDSPGSTGFAADAALGVIAADLALVVIDSDPARAPLIEPTLRWLEARRIPHALFVNKIDQARGTIEELLEALQPMSAAALVARQIPIRKGEQVTGFVDLALERAFLYQPGKPSQQVPIDDSLRDRETAARFHMLEQLADHDDILLEQLISDETAQPGNRVHRHRARDGRGAGGARAVRIGAEWLRRAPAAQDAAPRRAGRGADRRTAGDRGARRAGDQDPPRQRRRPAGARAGVRRGARRGRRAGRQCRARRGRARCSRSRAPPPRNWPAPSPATSSASPKPTASTPASCSGWRARRRAAARCSIRRSPIARWRSRRPTTRTTSASRPRWRR
ncbi:MAG: GTP-binding protein [Sphingomonas sp.]